MKIKVRYTIDTEYEFDDNQIRLNLDSEDDSPECWAKGWIEEDFIKIENRADNVLPDYKTNLEMIVEGQNEKT
jgi:hypothetical protein